MLRRYAALAALECRPAWSLDTARFIDHEVEDAIAFNSIPYEGDGSALLAKVRGLDLIQRLALIERIEAWWQERGS